jgi:signal transduction histidine kinase
VDERLRGLSADDISWDPSVSVTGVLELEENPEELQGQLPAIGGWTIRVASAADVSVERDAAWRAHCAAQVGWCVLAGIVVALVIALAAGVVLLLRFRSQKRALALLTDERKRMAADLHDTLEQQLASVRMVLNAAVSFTPNVPEKVAQAVTEANGLLAHAKSEMRARILNMRSDTLFTQGPAKVFAELARKFARSGVVSVRTRFRGLPDHLAESVFSEVVFIVGEAITNAVKHGKCRTIVLTSDPSPNGFTLSVANDGEPFDPAHALGPEAGHFGLTGMRERAKRADIALSFVHEGRWMILRLAVHG